MNLLVVVTLLMCIVSCTTKSVSSHNDAGQDIYKRLMSDLSELYSSSSQEKRQVPSKYRSKLRHQFPAGRGDSKVKIELLDELKTLLEDTTREIYKDAEKERRNNQPESKQGLHWKRDDQPQTHGSLIWKKKLDGASGIDWKKDAAQPKGNGGLVWKKDAAQPNNGGLIWKKDNGPPGSGLYWKKKDARQPKSQQGLVWKKKDSQPPQAQENGLIWNNKQANRGMKDERRELFGQIKSLLSKTLQKMDEMDGTKKEISNDIREEGDKKEELLSELKSLLSDEKKEVKQANDGEESEKNLLGELKTVLHDTLSNFEKGEEQPKPRDNVYKRLVNDLNGLFDKHDETTSGNKMSTLNDDLAELVQSTTH